LCGIQANLEAAAIWKFLDKTTSLIHKYYGMTGGQSVLPSFPARICSSLSEFFREDIEHRIHLQYRLGIP
jgi:hypothetical protein